MSDSVSKKEFYEELRNAEERSRVYTEKSHMDIADVVSRNIGSIQKEVAQIKEQVATVSSTFKDHCAKEEEHQKKMEDLLKGINFTDLKKSLEGYRDWEGFRNSIFSVGKWIAIITPIGATMIWIAKRLEL